MIPDTELETFVILETLSAPHCSPEKKNAEKTVPKGLEFAKNATAIPSNPNPFANASDTRYWLPSNSTVPAIPASPPLNAIDFTIDFFTLIPINVAASALFPLALNSYPDTV